MTAPAPALPARRTRAAVAMSAATAALAARAAMIAVASAEATAFATATAFAARAARLARCGSRGQLLLGGRRQQRLARQADLAAVRLDADHLHLDFVADLHEVRHLPDARVRHLGDVQQAVLPRENLHERAVRLDALHRAFVVRADLRRRGETLDDLDGALRRRRVGRGDGDLAVVLDVDLRARLLDDPADGL